MVDVEEELVTFGDDASDDQSRGADEADNGEADNAVAVSGATDYSKLTKAEAKAQLSKKEYKRWKKLHKKDKEKKEKKEKHKKEKQSEKTSKKEKRSAKDAHADRFEAPPAALPERQPTSLQVKAKTKISAGARRGEISSAAKDAVHAMENARKADVIAQKNGLPPLHRLQLRPKIMTIAQRPFMHEELLQCGFLRELAHWICDREKQLLAPLDLRTTAFDLLLGFDFEGVQSVRKKMQSAAQQKKGSEDISLAYEGISREHLQNSAIGEAVNFAKLHPSETRDNRGKAITLLERMSRAYNDDHEEEELDSGAKWPLMDHPEIASPFETVKSQTEAFQSSCIKMDPEDPLCYLRQPPKRYPKSFITGMNGGTNAGTKRSREEYSDED